MTRLSAVAELEAAYERGAHDDVLRSTAEILAERPGDDAAHELRARSLLALGRIDEAEQEISDAVRLDPEEIRYRELLAEILAARGAHRDAATEFGKLSRSAPRQADWTVSEARERLGAAQPEMSVDAARRAVRLDPGAFEAQLALSRGLARTGDPEGAAAAATRAATLRSGDPAAREALADARWLANAPRPALAEFAALAGELEGHDRERVLRKARSLVAQRGGWLSRLLASQPWLFPLALRRGWVRVP